MNYKLWKDVGKRELDPLLFSKTARELAELIGEEGRGKRNKNSQVRRYFDEVVRLNTIAQEGDEEDMKYRVLPQLHMLISKVAYAKGRNLITPSFEEMIKAGIEQVKDSEDLQVFTNFLESFMGFYKVYGPK
ncbi:MAG TPA: type III-A CRISPR-associated protein Csm2 [Dissulfuribacter thermophilus]|uniref:CRISPR system Cms protein Csm2 n=1 Tax=Dissulfuribacter thermophilus TaxID=1156395 RepID=A0A7V2SYX8_9BACT|nr:type III-A CRISPR-associated protein Csm2 [Dissulfuribacter thermophilus]